MNTKYRTINLILFIVLFTIVVFFLGRKSVKKSVNVNTADTVLVSIKVDTAKIQAQALINARGTIAQYDITKDGKWVKRKPKLIIFSSHSVDSSDSIKPAIQVAELDTTINKKKEKLKIIDSLNIKFASLANALNFNFSSNLVNDNDTSFYRLRLNANYVNSVWTIKLNENWEVKTKTITVETERIVPCKETFWTRFKFGPVMGVGYAVFNKTFDTFLGFGVLFDLR